MDDRKLKRLLPIAVLVGAALVVAALVLIRPEPQRAEPVEHAPLVRVVEATPQSLPLRVHAQGTVVPRTESDLVPEVAGRVEWVSPALVSGGAFDVGDPLVRVERADYEAALESANASVAQAWSEASRAAKELKRQRSLADRSVASEARIDDAENANRVAQASLRAAKAQLSRAERDLERTELQAPYAGRVRSESVDPGQFVNRGTPIARLYAVDYAEVRLPLPDRELAYLDPGLLTAIRGENGSRPAVRLSAEFAGKRHEWLGEIVRSEGEIDARSRMVHVVARVSDPYLLDDPVSDASSRRPPLAVGLFVDAEIDGRIAENAIVLPREALHDHRGTQGHVWVVGAEGRLQYREVDVLRAQRDEVVIRGGLRAGRAGFDFAPARAGRWHGGARRW